MTKSELRVVVDTNVAVSAAMSKNSVPRKILRQAQAHGKVLATIETLEELEEVLYRPKFDRYMDDEDRIDFLKEFMERIEQITITESVTECRDPKDDKFLEVAVSGKATHIVTGDADLLVMNPFRGIAIVRPQKFLEIVAKRNQEEPQQ